VSISNTTTSVLVMLNSSACSPCYTFDTKEKKQECLSAEYLRDILFWVAEAEPVMPEIFFLVGIEEQLDSFVVSVLEDMGDQIIVPLLPIDKQESLGIPFSRNQTVIASNLNEIAAQADNIACRPVILHVGPNEINRLAETLLTIQDFIGSISVRLHNIHLLEDQGVESYKQQLAAISDIGLMKRATGSEGKLGLLNLSVLGSAMNRITRCPAGTDFVTVGPDGFIYPCSAFYHVGQECSIGTINGTTDESPAISWNKQECGICGSARCVGCPFLESSQLVGKENICKVYKAENLAIEELLPRVAKSGYLFDCLRTLRTRDCATKSQDEGGESFIAGQQVHDITLSEFIQSLQDLKLAAELAAGKSSEDNNYEYILNRWSELPDIPPNSQRGIFRARVREILTELKQLKHLTPIPQRNSL